jgi:heme exporter protein B
MNDQALSMSLEQASEPGVFPGYLAMTQRELLLALRSRGEVVQPLVFFVIVVSLFPLGVGADSALLTRIAPGIVWVCGLLAALLSLPRLFNGDYADGTLEQQLLSPYPLAAMVAGKISAHWLVTGLPLALISPVLGLQFGLDTDALVLLAATLLLGTPLLSMIGAIGAALTLGTRGSSVLIALLVLPLYVPVLIFGAGAVEASLFATDYSGHLSLLGAGTLLGALFSPFVAAAALRISLD